MKKYRIVFEYTDNLSHGKWNEQEGIFWGKAPYEAVKECKELYGLGVDCEYKIKAVEPLE